MKRDLISDDLDIIDEVIRRLNSENIRISRIKVVYLYKIIFRYLKFLVNDSSTVSIKLPHLCTMYLPVRSAKYKYMRSKDNKNYRKSGVFRRQLELIEEHCSRVKNSLHIKIRMRKLTKLTSKENIKIIIDKQNNDYEEK